MKLTKYQHACFTLEENNQILVIDPGTLATDFIAPEQVVAVIITHQHADHLDPEHLSEIFAKNDNVIVLGPPDVIDKITIENKRAVKPGEKITVGPFSVEFFGGVHALIHASVPRIGNLGVMINDLIYYPGDSLDIPNKSIDVLALPAAAPWMKIGEAIDFLLAVHPRLAFPTHDAIMSESGKMIVDGLLSSLATQNGIAYQRLDDVIEL